MRQFQDIEKRWSLLFNTSIGVDLRQAVKDDGDFDPCEDGLRSICWKSYLLNGPLSQAQWTRKLKDSRSAYTSLHDHFLKFINNPNDLHSSADPLANDDSSPWATLRQDEISREEIWQDVIRCNVDNYFFREPTTQRKLLDILFIYSKLNPDTGYRQGMHELLAPILWVVYQDSVDVASVPSSKATNEGADFMLTALDSRYVEHDAFNLFCAVMQTAKAFYETGGNKDSSAIVAHSERIHNELLGAVDPDLCHHLQVVGVVPQIFAIRWLRLLFGREFEFKDVLKLWDVLFAESLHMEIIDMACVAILLRLRWQLIDADYTTAITVLTRLNLPKEDDSARAIVKDAAELDRRKNAEAGADITQLRTGRRQYTNPLGDEPLLRASTPQSRTHRRLKSQSQQASPSSSPARFATPQRQLESLFTNVSSNFQKNAEGWSVQNVSKALRGAVGEARRNIGQLQASHSRNSSIDVHRNALEGGTVPAFDPHQELAERLKNLEERNKALAKMLDSAQETLRKWKSSATQQTVKDEDVFNTALARIQFVSVYLADSDIAIPVTTPALEMKSFEDAAPLALPSETQQTKLDSADTAPPKTEPPATARPTNHPMSVSTHETTDQPQRSQSSTSMPTIDPPSHTPTLRPASPAREGASVSLHPVRPTLANSSFSFMLGEDRHRSSFVRATPLPEERRSSEAQAALQTLKDGKHGKIKGGKGGKDKERKGGGGGEKKGAGGGEGNTDDDGFTMSTLQ